MRGLLSTTAAAVSAACFVITSGCTSMRPDPYAVRVSDMGYMVKMDESYRAIPIGSPADRAWFDEQTRSLFAGRKSRADFLAEGEARFPGYGASWRRLADVFAPS